MGEHFNGQWRNDQASLLACNWMCAKRMHLCTPVPTIKLIEPCLFENLSCCYFFPILWFTVYELFSNK